MLFHFAPGASATRNRTCPSRVRSAPSVAAACRVPSRNVVYSRAKMAPPVRRLASFPLLARPRSRRRWHNQRNQDPQSLARFLCADLQTSRLERCRRASNRRVPVLPFRRFAVSIPGIVSPSALSSLRFPLRNRTDMDTERTHRVPLRCRCRATSEFPWRSPVK